MPAERIQYRVPGGWGEAGGQADLDAGVAQRSQRLCGSREGRYPSGPDDPRIVLLEGVVGGGGCLVTENSPAHLGLRLTHAGLHDLSSPVLCAAARADTRLLAHS